MPATWPGCPQGLWKQWGKGQETLAQACSCQAPLQGGQSWDLGSHFRSGGRPCHRNYGGDLKVSEGDLESDEGGLEFNNKGLESSERGRKSNDVGLESKDAGLESGDRGFQSSEGSLESSEGNLL